jgi:hypothetical protein
MRGFRAECIIGPATRPPVQADPAPPASGAFETRRRFKARLSRLAEAVRSLSPWSHAPRQGEVFVKVRAGSALEAQAARHILHAAGAGEPADLGAKWTNWNW